MADKNTRKLNAAQEESQKHNKKRKGKQSENENDLEKYNNDSFGEFQIPTGPNIKENAQYTAQAVTDRQAILTQKLKDYVHSIPQRLEEERMKIDIIPLNSEGGEFSNNQINSISNFNSGQANKSMSFLKGKEYKERDFLNLGHQQGQIESNILNSPTGSNTQLIKNFSPNQTFKMVGSQQQIIVNKESSDSNNPLQRRNTVWSTRHSTILQQPLKQVKNKMNSVVPASGSKSMSNMNSIESNITKMVKLVKLRSKAIELKKYFLRQSISKKLLAEQGSLFAKVIDDATSNQIEQEKFPEKFWIYQCVKNLKFIQFLVLQLSKIPTIDPSSKFKIIWDLIMGIVLMLYFFCIPIHIAINVPIHELLTQQLGASLQIVMGFDVAFSMITGFFEKGINESNKQKILLYYINNYFWGDLISQIPLLISELGSQDSQVEKIFVMCFFIKLRNFQKIFRKFEESFHLTPRSQNLISLVKLILTILFFSHIFSCIWIFVGKQQGNDQNWMSKGNLIDQTWVQQYIAAYYFSTVTMITVGYGDIVPISNLERIVSVGTMLISCVIFAYMINQIGTIFADLFSQDRQMKEYFNIINDYMDYKNIGFSLQYKIREYLDYYWREQDSNKSELEKKIIDSLSDQLREKLMLEANRIVLKDSSVFSNYFNNSVILKMIPIIQTLHTPPNQTIYSEGQIDEDMFIYFIEKGKVEICRELNLSEDKKVFKSVITLGQGQCFGSWSFVTSLGRQEMVRSLEFSKLLMVRRCDFLDIIKENPQDLEKFNMLKDSILFEKNQQHLDVKCSNCQSINHSVQHCHYFHFSPDKYVIIRRYNLYFKKQDRDELYRRKNPLIVYKQFNDFEEIMSEGKRWKEEQQDFLEQYIQEFLLASKDQGENEDYYYQEGNSGDDFDQENSEDEFLTSSLGTSRSGDYNNTYSEQQSQESSDRYISSERQIVKRQRNKHQNEEIKEEEQENDLTQSRINHRNSNFRGSLKQNTNLDSQGSDEVIEISPSHRSQGKKLNNSSNYIIKVKNPSESEGSEKNMNYNQRQGQQSWNEEKDIQIQNKTRGVESIMKENNDQEIQKKQELKIQELSEIQSDGLSLSNYGNSSTKHVFDKQNDFNNYKKDPNLRVQKEPNNQLRKQNSCKSPFSDQSQDLCQRRGRGFSGLTIQTNQQGNQSKLMQEKMQTSIYCEEKEIFSNQENNHDDSPELIILKRNSSAESEQNHKQHSNIREAYRFEDIVVVDDFNCQDFKAQSKQYSQEGNVVNYQEKNAIKGISQKDKTKPVRKISIQFDGIDSFKDSESKKKRKSSESQFPDRKNSSKRKKSNEKKVFERQIEQDNPQKQFPRKLKRTKTSGDISSMLKQTSPTRKSVSTPFNQPKNVALQKQPSRRASTQQFISFEDGGVIKQQNSKKRLDKKIYKDFLEDEKPNSVNPFNERRKSTTIPTKMERENSDKVNKQQNPSHSSLSNNQLSAGIQSNKNFFSPPSLAILAPSPTLSSKEQSTIAPYQDMNAILKKKLSGKERIKEEGNISRRKSTDSARSNSSSCKDAFMNANAANQNSYQRPKKKSVFSKSYKEQGLKNVMKDQIIQNPSPFLQKNTFLNNLLPPSNPLIHQGHHFHHNQTPHKQGSPTSNPDSGRLISLHKFSQSGISHDNTLIPQNCKMDSSPSSAVSLRVLKHTRAPQLSQAQATLHQLAGIKPLSQTQNSNLQKLPHNLETNHENQPYTNILRKNLMNMDDLSQGRRSLKSLTNNQSSNNSLPQKSNYFSKRESLKTPSDMVSNSLFDNMKKNSNSINAIVSNSNTNSNNNNNLVNINASKEEQKPQQLDNSIQNQILNLLQNNLNLQQLQQNQQNQQQFNSLQQQSIQPTQHVALISHNQPVPSNINFYEQNIDSSKGIYLISDFDVMKLFKFYFPKGNCTTVVQKANTPITNRLQKIIKKLRKAKAPIKRINKLEDIAIIAARKNSILLKKPPQRKKSDPIIESLSSIPNFDDNNQFNRSKDLKPIENSIHMNNMMEESQISQESDHQKFPSSQSEIRPSEGIAGIQSPQRIQKSIFNRASINQ